MKCSSSPDAPQVVVETAELRAAINEARANRCTIGLVPTMGALHEGHLTLLDACRRECDINVVSIYVNPAQFSPSEDFHRYPRPLEADVALVASRGADIVFTPSDESMYAGGHATYVDVAGPALPLEGQFRPGHFRGVGTIVLKLFNLVQPDRAYFGRKDYQQSVVVRRMVADLNLPIHVDVCPTVRDADGLALSSRNVYLSPDERRRALSINASLKLARQMVEQGEKNAAKILSQMKDKMEASDLKIDYVAIVDPDTLAAVETVDRPSVALVAARVGATRLIDNEIIE